MIRYMRNGSVQTISISAKKPRSGKTARDRASGALARRHDNHAKRDAWCNDRRSSNNSWPLSQSYPD